MINTFTVRSFQDHSDILLNILLNTLIMILKGAVDG